MSKTKTIKIAQEATATSSRYIDSRGKVFSAQEIVQGYKPKKPYKLYSLSNKVRNFVPGKKKGE